MTRVKICGLRRECDIAYANRLLPDYIGFIFAKKSRRYLTPETAAQLKARLDGRIKAVGVFVDAPAAEIAALAQAGTIDLVQLHGHEDAAYIRALRESVSLPLIQAFRVDTPDDLRRAEASAADYILLDNGAGGTGERFDWSLLQEMRRPFFLAGGLDADNAAEAIAQTHPFAVDVSSGVETDGVKDFEKMKAFVQAVQRSKT
jgi:phosphoribosylanthranilate isomerase